MVDELGRLGRIISLHRIHLYHTNIVPRVLLQRIFKFVPRKYAAYDRGSIYVYGQFLFFNGRQNCSDVFTRRVF